MPPFIVESTAVYNCSISRTAAEISGLNALKFKSPIFKLANILDTFYNAAPTLLTFSAIASIYVSLDAFGNIFLLNSATYFLADSIAVDNFFPIAEPGSTLANAVSSSFKLA